MGNVPVITGPGGMDVCDHDCGEQIVDSVRGLLELLSGVSDVSLRGATWLPTEDPARYCRRIGATSAFVAEDDLLCEQKIASLKAAGIAVCISVNGPFSRAAEEIGWEEAIAYSAKKPKLFRDYIDPCRDAIFAAGELGADCIVITDEVSSVQRPLVDPKFVEKTLLGMYETMIGDAESQGTPSIFHSDGNIRWLLPFLSRAGFCGVHIACGGDLSLIQELFAATVYEEMVPFGGVPAVLLDGYTDLQELADHVQTLAETYPCVICDDGGLVTEDEIVTLSHVY